jgi:hypothetical protein
MANYNGDLKLLSHQIGDLTGKIGSLDGKLETNIAVHNDRLREAEKQSALQEQSLQAICRKVESLDDDVKKISLVSKIIGGIAGGLAVIAAAIGIGK